jgi:hypothetical protein
MSRPPLAPPNPKPVTRPGSSLWPPPPFSLLSSPLNSLSRASQGRPRQEWLRPRPYPVVTPPVSCQDTRVGRAVAEPGRDPTRPDDRAPDRAAARSRRQAEPSSAPCASDVDPAPSTPRARYQASCPAQPPAEVPHRLSVTSLKELQCRCYLPPLMNAINGLEASQPSPSLHGAPRPPLSCL